MSDRVELVSNTEGKIWSSSGNKYYEVSYDPDNQLIMSNDNSSYWKSELGYPAIAFLLAADYVEVDKSSFKFLGGILWKDINQKYKNDFPAAAKEVLSNLEPADKQSVETFAEEILQQIKSMDLGFLGKRQFPPKGY